MFLARTPTQEDEEEKKKVLDEIIVRLDGHEPKFILFFFSMTAKRVVNKQMRAIASK